MPSDLLAVVDRAVIDSHCHVMLKQDEQIRSYWLSGDEQGLLDEQSERHGDMIDWSSP